MLIRDDLTIGFTEDEARAEIQILIDNLQQMILNAEAEMTGLRAADIPGAAVSHGTRYIDNREAHDAYCSGYKQAKGLLERATKEVRL